MSEIEYWKTIKSKKEIKLHTEKFKTLLCSDCAKTIFDDDEKLEGDEKIIEHYVKDEEAFLQVPSVGRKPERCAKCNKKRTRKRDRERRRKEREQAKHQERSDCMHWAECSKDLVPRNYETAEEMQRELCFDCAEYKRP